MEGIVGTLVMIVSTLVVLAYPSYDERFAMQLE
jgi:hypothetical protein